MSKRINMDAAHEEFQHLKQRNLTRNNRYWLNRQAVRGNFRWPRDWPTHIPRVTHNLCKPIVERFATYLIGKGFSWNLERPNTPEFRSAAERSEKILNRLFDLSAAPLQWQEGAKNGSQVGRTVYKVYVKGKPGRQYAAFTSCQPDYFYPVFASDDWVTGELSTVYYSYPLDRNEVVRRWGNRPYKSEEELATDQRYDALPERRSGDQRDTKARRIPVLEVWTPDAYAIEVGGIVVVNEPHQFKWSDTGQGFVPFVVIENVRNAGAAEGEADIEQTRLINEELNYLLSRKTHVVSRWLRPTVVWEGAPQNYAEVLTNSLEGGGAIPARLGSRISLLSYDRDMPAVAQLEETLRAAALESAGMNEVALQGITTGSVNTGPALAAQFQPVISTVEKKRLGWEHGIRTLCAMLLEAQEGLGETQALGEAVVNQTYRSEEFGDGELVELTGEDIQGLRRVDLSWPGVLPADDAQSSQLEIEKMTAGIQSIYTTLEKLGEEYPEDELARIRMEAQDSGLQGGKVAEQVRAQTPLMKAQMDQELQMQQMAAQGGPPGPGGPQAPGPAALEAGLDDPTALEAAAEGQDVGAMLREAVKSSRARIEEDPDDPTLEQPSPLTALLEGGGAL